MSQTRNTLTLAIRLNALLRYSRRMLAIGLVALLAGTARAQVPVQAPRPIPTPTARPQRPLPTPGQPTVQLTETEVETIAKCLRDLKSPTVEDRRRAAMIIGKYNTPEAEQAVIDCLSDQDAVVRQSALVALTEDRMFPPGARMPVFRLLRDPDVHIRRIASALIPEASGISLSGPVAITGNITIRAGGGRTDEETEEALACLNHALSDDDPSVRRNVLSGARFFPKPLAPAKIETFFADPDAEVRTLALIAYAQVIGQEAERAVRLQPLTQDPVPAVRQELARTAARLGGDGTPILKNLLNDQDIAVRAEAVRQFAGQLDPDAFPPLSAMLRDRQLPADLRKSLLPLLRVFPDQSGPLYEELLAQGPPELQAEALRAIGADQADPRPLDFFLPFIQSPSAPVRQMAATVITRRRQELTPEHIQTLMTAKAPEARLLAVRTCAALPEPQRGELLLDACLDADVAVRQQALLQIATFRPEGWQDILLASMSDPNLDIRDAAARGLVRLPQPSPEIVTALQNHLETCQNEMTRRLITNFLTRNAAQEEARQRRLDAQEAARQRRQQRTPTPQQLQTPPRRFAPQVAPARPAPAPQQPVAPPAQ